MVETSLRPRSSPLRSLDELRPDLPLAFQPSYGVLKTDWRVTRLLKQPGARARRATGSSACFFRGAAGVHVREARQWERQVHHQSLRGRSLLEVVERLGLPAEELASLLAGWAREGLLVQQAPT